MSQATRHIQATAFVMGTSQRETLRPGERRRAAALFALSFTRLMRSE